MARRSLSKNSIGDDSPPHRRRNVIILKPGEGRHYGLGLLTGVFKADEAETEAAYSVSEWILKTGLKGVGGHSHAGNDEVFYVLEGVPEILVDDCWWRCTPGTFLRIPAGVVHDFRNTGKTTARLLNLFIPGGFERNMPEISAWFAAQEKI
ncbi:cupin domain-containing protein [Sinorhizobium garamanticum]|uniref:Cupin domain-containing protein n=1 Tax=Sinorhizobium garamanticum TaxID=680247 RepID=A0ABY8DBX3_9HYPH|nr:cupin domain-containing protein [Sinorhizobium garamanticum]WEX87802.1 cupin domain-containing protein [Sinorhizobium garamanticum]